MRNKTALQVVLNIIAESLVNRLVRVIKRRLSKTPS